MKIDLKALKTRADIVAVIRAHDVALKPKGANFVALCPFPPHREKTPSFTVDPKKRIFKCFGCKVGGDVFKFVQMKTGLKLPQVIERVAELTDGPTPATLRAPVSTTMAPIGEAATDAAPQAVLDRVTALWQTELARGAKAQEYLTGRGVWHPELVRALHIGYSSGSLSRKLPGGGKLRRQLLAMGYLTERGTEFFYGRVVIPLYNEGQLVNVYGRAISPTSAVKHLYLKGPQRGVFNQSGVRNARQVILTESPLDALSLLVLGFTNVTTSYGADGFTADLRAELVRSKTERIYCVYDPDTAGNTGATDLARKLESHGIEVRRVTFSSKCKDPNDFLRNGGTREKFQALLDQAYPLTNGDSRRPARAVTDAVSTPVSVEPTLAAAPAASLAPLTGLSAAPIVADPTPPAAAAPVPPPTLPAVGPAPAAGPIVLGDRTYQLEGDPVRVGNALNVRVRATRGEHRWVETFNVYSPHGRSCFIRNVQTAFRGQVPRKILEEDFFTLFDALEERAPQTAAVATSGPAVPPMSEGERQAALDFLTSPDLVRLILEHVTRMGVVGEDDNKLLVYLVATSCLLPCCLSLSVISQSSAGKSWIINRVLDLFPRERVLRFTRMSPRAIFYEEPGRFRNKILFIEEAIGAKDADLGVRSMVSEKRVANMVTTTDPKTGQLKTQETVVEGPLTYMTSSVTPLDYETSTRSFEITIDESSEQTTRIVDRLRFERTLAGKRERYAVQALQTLHQNAQRLLEPIEVVNEYLDQLTFPSESLRLRREATKYFSLIETVAFLHQHQRPRKSFTEGGQTVAYIEVIPADVAIANRLTVSCLARALSGLTGPTEELLFAIRSYVTGESKGRGCDVLSVAFSRKDLREMTRVSNSQLHDSLEELVEMDYIEVVAGSFGKRYVYTLAPDHRLVVQASLSLAEKIVTLGLTPADRLVDPETFRSQSDLSRKG